MDKIITKKCKKCGETDFYKSGGCKNCVKARNNKYRAEHPEEARARHKKYHAEHREEHCAYNKKHYAEHREERRARNKKHYAEHREEARAIALMRNYGITIEEYDNMFAAQNGICAICGKPQNGKRLFVDHNHETDKVRGLLCQNCNIALGHMGDDAQLLIKAIDYLMKDNQR